MGISHEEQTVKLCSVIRNRHRCASPQTKEWSKWPCYIFYKQYVSVWLLSYYVKDNNCFACQYTRIQNLLYTSIFFLLNDLKRSCWLFSTGLFFRGADSFLIFLTCLWTAWILLSRARSKILTSSHPLQIREFHSYI